MRQSGFALAFGDSQPHDWEQRNAMSDNRPIPKLIEKPDLPNKPLVEAILDVRWALTARDNAKHDPHYKLLVGSYYTKIRSEYPEHVQKPEAMIPDEVIPYIPQHQFRAAANEWPLIQLGPGILTVNDTQKYTWCDFRERACRAIAALFDAYPNTTDLRISSVLLKYIDAVAFDYVAGDAFAFLKGKMGITIEFPQRLFDAIPADASPQRFNMTAAFRCNNPQGAFSVKFATGLKDGARALIWETSMETSDSDVPRSPREIATWLDQAHVITHNSFFKLVEGELERSFRNG